MIYWLVGVPGFEPGTSCSQSRRANRTALHPESDWFSKSDAKVQLFFILPSIMPKKNEKKGVFLALLVFFERKSIMV